MFSVRIVDADFYVTKPVAGLDVLYSEFRESNVSRVPVLRIFGSTPSGQKTCLHVHRVFPYIFVPYDGTQPSDKYLKQFATSVDFAVQVALGKASSSTRHVHHASIVKRIPFYGYHEEEQDFIKIQFYNPRIIARVVELLQNGAILNKVFQPYEAHIPYILQFLIDFNLYGMNLLHAGKAMFRGWVSSEINGPTRQPSPCSESSSPFSANMSGLSHVSTTVYQHWSEKTISSGLRLDSDVPKTSRCELEVDIVSTDILNQLEIGTSIGANPGIVAMWEDEKQRRCQHDQSSQITLPVSQDRGDLPILDAEKAFKATIREIISKRNQLVQSQLDKMEKSQVDSLSPEDFQELSQSILLDLKEPESPVMLSEDVDENEPIVDETVIEDVLQASQSQSQRLSGRFDSDLIDILVSLADDPNEPVPQECSQKSGTSEAVVAEDRLAVDESEDENEDEESFLMSEPVWQGDLSGHSEELFCGEKSEDAKDMASKPSRVPQLDGTVDEETELSKIPLSTSFVALKKKDEGYSTEQKYSPFSNGPEVEERTRSDRFPLRIPQLDGCHDEKDDKHHDETRPSSTCEKRALKSTFHEVEELEDFRIEKKRRARRTRQVKGGSQNKANSTTRQRKATVGSLAVSGGDPKTRKTSSCEGTTSVTEATTSDAGHTAKFDTRGHRGEAESARVCDDTSNRDLVSLFSMRDTGGPAFSRKQDEIAPKKNSRILLREAEVSSCPITSAAAEVSSESQTSDFELRLSDSSSDNSDFKSSAKISRIPSLGSDRRSAAEDLSGFGKPENSQKAGETASPLIDNTPSFGLVCESRNKAVAGNSRNIKARRNVDSEKFSENSTKNSKPREKRRTRIVGCLEFTVQNAMPEAKGNSPLKFEAALPSRKAGNSRKRTRSDKRSKEDGSRGRKRKKTDEGDVEIVLGSPEEGRINEKYGEKGIKIAKNAALLDACVKLEKLFVEKGKRGYKVIREDSEKLNTCLIENEKYEKKKVEKDSEEPERISGGNEKHEDTVFQKDFEVIRDDSEMCLIENEKYEKMKVEKDSEKSEMISVGKEKHENTVVQKDSDKPGRFPVGKGESQHKEVRKNSENFEGFPAGKEKMKDKEVLKDVENFEMFSFENEKSKNIVVSDDSSKPKMLYMGNEKSENSGLLKDFEKHGSSRSRSEQTDEPGCPNLEPPVVDEKLDLYSNALYHMAMLSPKSDPSEDQSPPFPSSPSRNTSPDELVHGLLGSLMKCETKDVEVKDEVECVKDSLGSPWEGVDFDFDNHSMIQQSDEKELDVEADVPVRRSLVNELGISRHGGMQEGGNAVNLEDDEGRIEMLKEAVKSDKITSSGASTVGDSFGFQDDKSLETDSSGQEGNAMNLEDNEGRIEMLKEAVKSDKITSSGASTVGDSFGFQDGESLQTDSSGKEGNAVNLEDNERRIEILKETVKSDKIPSSGASTVGDSFGFQDGESLETDSSGREGDAVNVEDNEGRIEVHGELGVKEPSGRCKIWKPVKDPPSLSYVLKTRDLYGLPHERHQKAFCSDPRDVPSVTRTVNGKRLQVSSLSVEELSEFNLGGNFQTLSEMRSRMGDQADNSFVRGCLRTLMTDRGSEDDRGYSGDPAHIKLALIGEKDVVITPARFPPTLDIVRRWMDENRPVSVKNLASNASETRQTPNSSPKQDEGDDAQKCPTVPSTDETGITKTPKQLGSFVNHDYVQEKIESSEEVPGFFQTPRSGSRLSVLQGMAQLGHGGTGAENHVPRRSSDVSPGPQHSTPLGNEPKCRGLLRCTPIASGSSQKPGKGCSQQEVAINFVNDEQCCRISNLRRNILDSQTKENAGQGYRQTSVDASYIEGPTPTNSCGFKISQPNIQDAKALHEIQYLTILSVELHIRTRKTLRPDPEFDAICAIFYDIEHETKEGKKNITGVIVASNESTKLSRATDSMPSTSRDESRGGDGVSNRDVGGTKGNSEGGISRGWSKESILRKSGLNDDVEIITVDEESEAISCFVKLVHDWDPDLLVGYEVQMLSWGYLLQRSTTLGIDLASQLSRLQDSSGTTRFDADRDKWGASHTSEIVIAGRIVLNVWRLMRHEVSLNIYSFENIAYHVLHERIPLYTFQQLSRWWDQKMPHSRWRTAEHYITRCQGNIRILNYSDLVNRTSEFARLFGILFYSVVSRGSQFRVESMMLRLAKPMNYVAVSPSIQQRARMCAPECIPLVMEPESRFYTDPVVVLDFQSLYPTMIIAYNYCFSTCLGRVSHLNELGNFDFGCTSLNVPPGLLERLEDDIHVCANGAAFVKSNVRRGILPRMLEEILNTRIMVKKAMKEYRQDKALGKLLDARQLGLKLIANVTYGYTSANFSGRMPCVEIADAIVRKARETLERAIHLVNTREEWGARVVYGDTDSLFVLLKGATKEEAFKIGQEIVEAVTATNPKPVKLKFEKVYLPCVLQTKKRYVGYMYETLEQKEPVFDAKGIETVRRDNCPAVAKILEKSLRILFEARDVSLVKKFVQRQFRKLMEDRVSLQDFTFAKEYRGMKNYKPTACVPALSLAKRRLSRDRRAEPRVGERVPYVVVYGSPGLPLIQLVRSLEDVLNDPSLRLNAVYYINKQIIPTLNRALGLIGIDVSTWYTELPRFAPRQQEAAAKQKSTISRYFTTLHCPVCEDLTHQGLCHACRDNPQKSVTILADRITNWERKYDHLTQICFQCCGTRDPEMVCISLDCPVLFKMVKTKRSLSYAEMLRDVQRKIEIANC